ncbi:MAG: hypothetical protein LBJ63_03610 [Prevotellaceae bacterium]|jgi:hypothetical protein|nr:hypothetical protein [Prevotellaceae bacterium]
MGNDSTVIVLALIISFVIPLLGVNRRIGYGWGLFFCLFLSPIIGLIIILCSKKKSPEFIDINKKEEKQ